MGTRPVPLQQLSLSQPALSQGVREKLVFNTDTRARARAFIRAFSDADRELTARRVEVYVMAWIPIPQRRRGNGYNRAFPQEASRWRPPRRTSLRTVRLRPCTNAG